MTVPLTRFPSQPTHRPRQEQSNASPCVRESSFFIVLCPPYLFQHVRQQVGGVKVPDNFLVHFIRIFNLVGKFNLETIIGINLTILLFKYLHSEISTHEETIEQLQCKIQTMQSDHQRERMELEAKHQSELNRKEAAHTEETTRLKRHIT